MGCNCAGNKQSKNDQVVPRTPLVPDQYIYVVKTEDAEIEFDFVHEAAIYNRSHLDGRGSVQRRVRPLV